MTFLNFFRLLPFYFFSLLPQDKMQTRAAIGSFFFPSSSSFEIFILNLYY